MQNKRNPSHSLTLLAFLLVITHSPTTSTLTLKLAATATASCATQNPSRPQITPKHITPPRPPHFPPLHPQPPKHPPRRRGGREHAMRRKSSAGKRKKYV